MVCVLDRKNSKYNIKFVPARTKFKNRTGWLADHPHLGETYQERQFKDIDGKRDRFGFYDGQDEIEFCSDFSYGAFGAEYAWKGIRTANLYVDMSMK